MNADRCAEIQPDHANNARWSIFRADNAGNAMAISVGFEHDRSRSSCWLSLPQARALAAALNAHCDVLDMDAHEPEPVAEVVF